MTVTTIAKGNKLGKVSPPIVKTIYFVEVGHVARKSDQSVKIDLQRKLRFQTQIQEYSVVYQTAKLKQSVLRATDHSLIRQYQNHLGAPALHRTDWTDSHALQMQSPFPNPSGPHKRLVLAACHS